MTNYKIHILQLLELQTLAWKITAQGLEIWWIEKGWDRPSPKGVCYSGNEDRMLSGKRSHPIKN